MLTRLLVALLLLVIGSAAGQTFHQVIEDPTWPTVDGIAVPGFGANVACAQIHVRPPHTGTSVAATDYYPICVSTTASQQDLQVFLSLHGSFQRFRTLEVDNTNSTCSTPRRPEITFKVGVDTLIVRNSGIIVAGSTAGVHIWRLNPLKLSGGVHNIDWVPDTSISFATVLYGETCATARVIATLSQDERMLAVVESTGSQRNIYHGADPTLVSESVAMFHALQDPGFINYHWKLTKRAHIKVDADSSCPTGHVATVLGWGSPQDLFAIFLPRPITGASACQAFSLALKRSALDTVQSSGVTVGVDDDFDDRASELLMATLPRSPLLPHRTAAILSPNLLAVLYDDLEVHLFRLPSSRQASISKLPSLPGLQPSELPDAHPLVLVADGRVLMRGFQLFQFHVNADDRQPPIRDFDSFADLRVSFRRLKDFAEEGGRLLDDQLGRPLFQPGAGASALTSASVSGDFAAFSMMYSVNTTIATATDRLMIWSMCDLMDVMLLCEDHDRCTDDACDPAGGCRHFPTVCEDGNLCTIDQCDGVRGCLSHPIDCNDGEICTDDRCDPETGSCIYVPTSCSDGKMCTLDFCNSKNEDGCYFEQVTCDDGNPCTVDPQCAECGELTDDASAIACVLCNNTRPDYQPELLLGERCDPPPLDTSATAIPACVEYVCVEHPECVALAANPNRTDIVHKCPDAVCQIQLFPERFPDHNPCTHDVCDPVLGMQYIPTNEGLPCIRTDAVTGEVQCEDPDQLCRDGQCILEDFGDAKFDNIECQAWSCATSGSTSIKRLINLPGGTSCTEPTHRFLRLPDGRTMPQAIDRDNPLQPSEVCRTNHTCAGSGNGLVPGWACVVGEQEVCDDGNVCTIAEHLVDEFGECRCIQHNNIGNPCSVEPRDDEENAASMCLKRKECRLVAGVAECQPVPRSLEETKERYCSTKDPPCDPKCVLASPEPPDRELTCSEDRYPGAGYRFSSAALLKPPRQCDDGDPCTINDQCQPDMTCRGSDKVCHPPPGTPELECSRFTCNPLDGGACQQVDPCDDDMLSKLGLTLSQCRVAVCQPLAETHPETGGNFTCQIKANPFALCDLGDRECKVPGSDRCVEGRCVAQFQQCTKHPTKPFYVTIDTYQRTDVVGKFSAQLAGSWYSVSIGSVYTWTFPDDPDDSGKIEVLQGPAVEHQWLNTGAQRVHLKINATIETFDETYDVYVQSGVTATIVSLWFVWLQLLICICGIVDLCQRNKLTWQTGPRVIKSCLCALPDCISSTAHTCRDGGCLECAGSAKDTCYAVCCGCRSKSADYHDLNSTQMKEMSYSLNVAMTSKSSGAEDPFKQDGVPCEAEDTLEHVAAMVPDRNPQNGVVFEDRFVPPDMLETKLTDLVEMLPQLEHVPAHTARPGTVCVRRAGVDSAAGVIGPDDDEMLLYEDRAATPGSGRKSTRCIVS